MAVALAPLDVVKGAEIFVRFSMKYGDGSDAPSEVYGGWVTRVTTVGVVWVRFGGQAKRGNTLVFDLHHMVGDARNYFRVNESAESACADALLQVSREPMMFCIDI